MTRPRSSRSVFHCVLVATALIGCKKDRDSPAKGLSPESCEAGTAKVVPALVVDGLASPFDVAVDATSVYWTEVGGTGVVGVIDKDGTGRRKLVSESANLPFAIALSSTHVFFQTSNEIQRVPKDGSAAPQILATGFDNLQSYGLVVDGDQVYFAARQRSDDKDGVYRVDIDGKNVVNIVSQSTGIDALSIDTEYVYFNSGSVAEPTLVRVSKAGGAPETIATGRGCHNVASTGFQVFCAADYYGPFRINVTTKSTIDLCAEWNPALLVKDTVLLGTGLYLLVDSPDKDDFVLRVSTAGTGELFATGLATPRRAATDGGALYFTETDAGRICRLAL